MTERGPIACDRHELTVVTYNIHRALGTDGRHDSDRIASVLAALDGDVIALQEVDSESGGHSPPSKGTHRTPTEEGFAERSARSSEGSSARSPASQLDVLASATGMRSVAGPALRRHYGDYGNALLTRLEVVEVRRHDLSVVRREPRAVLDVDLVCPGTRSGLLRVITTHFGLRRAERRLQLAKLLPLLARRPDERALVLLGDFNVWTPRNAITRGLDGMLGRSPARRSFPSRTPLFALDRIWVRPADCLVGVDAVRTPTTRRASDHLPVRGRLVLPEAPASRSTGDRM